MDQRRPFFAAVGEQLVLSVGRNFKAEAAPDGTPWAPLAPATVKARSRRSRPQLAILRDRRLLAGSINHQATDDEVRVGSPTGYAAIHQPGGASDQSKRQGRKFRARTTASLPRTGAQDGMRLVPDPGELTHGLAAR